MNFLAFTLYYSISLHHESCTTLFTNYNIHTQGVVKAKKFMHNIIYYIGDNIEYHVFFPDDEELIDYAVIVACDRALIVLAEVKVE